MLDFRPCPKSLHQIIQLNPKYVDIFKSYQYTDFKTQLYQVPYSKYWCTGVNRMCQWSSCMLTANALGTVRSTKRVVVTWFQPYGRWQSVQEFQINPKQCVLEVADCVMLNNGLPAAGGTEMIFRERMLWVPGRSGLRHANESKNSDLRLEFSNVQSTQKSVLEPRMGTCKRETGLKRT